MIEAGYARRLREHPGRWRCFLKQAHDRIRKIAECLDDKGLAALRQARRAAGEMWPQLEARGEVGLPAGSRRSSRDCSLPTTSSNRCPPIECGGRRSWRLPTARSTRRRMPTGRAVPGCHRKDQGPTGMECRCPNPCGSRCFNPLASRCCAELGSVRWVAGRAKPAVRREPDGVRRGGPGRVVRPGRRPNPEDDHAAGGEGQAGAGLRVLHGFVENEDQVKQAVARLQDHLLKLLMKASRSWWSDTAVWTRPFATNSVAS